MRIQIVWIKNFHPASSTIITKRERENKREQGTSSWAAKKSLYQIF